MLDRADDGREEGVRDAADHKANGIDLGAGKVSGCAVRHVVQVGHSLHDLVSDLVGDVGMVVEDTGDRRDRNAAVGCDILDGHCSPLPSVTFTDS
jgi:hypothetical protein